MGNLGGGANAQPEPAAAEPPQLPAWLETLHTCPKVDIIIWEDYMYTGGSLHPPWSMQLLILEESRIWGARVRTVDLKSLDPVLVASAATRLEEPGSLIARGGMDFRYSCPRGMENKELREQHYGTPQWPYALGADACVDLAKYKAQKLDQHRYNYQLTSVAQNEHNVVLEFDIGPPPCYLLWLWALKQWGLQNEDLRRLIVSHIDTRTGSWAGRWVYVLMSGYKFKGRRPGLAVSHWHRDS